MSIRSAPLPEILRFIKRMGWCLCLFVALVLPVRSAVAASPVSPVLEQLAWKIDPGGGATWQEMAAASDWQSFDTTEAWGFGQAPVWVRYRLRAALPDEQGPWAITVSPLFLEKLRLHDPVAGLDMQAGQAVQRARWSMDSVSYLFPIPALSQPRDVFLRLDTDSTRVIVTRVQPLHQAIEDSNRKLWLFSSLVALSAIFTLWSCVQWAITREKVMGAFALKQSLATAWGLSWTGLAHLLAGDSVDAATLSNVSLWVRIWTIAATSWFFFTLIQDYKPPKNWLRIIRFLIGALVLLPLLQVIDLPVRMTANILMIVVLSLLLCALVASSKRRPRAPLPWGVLVAYLSLYVFINVVPPMINLGLLPPHPVAMQLNFSHIFLDGLVMFLLLQLRWRELTKRAQRMAERQVRIHMKMDMAQETAALERQRREEQSQFLHMLMHELKTPLSVIALALGARTNRESSLVQAGLAVQEMKAIIDRCIQSDQNGEPTHAQKIQPVGMSECVQSVALGMDGLEPRLVLRAPDSLPPVHTDQQLLRIVVTNLLHNADHYSDPLTPVTVVLQDQEFQGRTGISLRVQNVPGLAGWPDPKRLFQKYYRASGALRESGSGLGLFLSRQLASSLGASLRYEPSEHHVEFVLWIPLQPL